MNQDHHIIYKLLDIITEHFKTPNLPVIKYLEPKKLKRKLNLSINKEGKNSLEILSFAKEYLYHCVQTHNKKFCNQLFSRYNLYALLGEILAIFTNTSMYTYETSPVATLIEIEILEKMRNLIGFKHGEGLFVTGGSNSNTIAMICARNKYIPNAKQKGIQNYNLVAFVSDQSHYSFMKASNVIGIGSNNIIRVQSDENGKMITSDLEKEILIAIDKGKSPFFVASTAGTTVLGAFDDFNKTSQIVKKYNLWWHIDGSYGASIALSKKYKYLLKNSNLADSFTWNPHKLMGIPLICSTFLTKHNNILESLTDELSTEYLFHDHSYSEYDLGNKSLQCGRRVDALKLWTSWQYYGDDGYEREINNLMELSQYAKNLVESNNNLKLAFPVQFLNICFQYIPKNKNIDINEFNEKLREYLVKNGELLINYAKLKNKKFFRLVINNYELTKNDIKIFFDIILKCANKINL